MPESKPPDITKAAGMCPHGNFPDACEACHGSQRKEKTLKYLDRIHARDVLETDDKFFDWLGGLSFDQFKEHLANLNGLLRDKPKTQRSFDGTTVEIGSEARGVDYLPPAPQDKEQLMKEVFESMNDIKDRRDIALLLYLAIQAIHPFADGNGRTGRLIYRLLNGEWTGKAFATDKELSELITHREGEEEGRGRKKMEGEIKPPEEIYRFINREMVKDLFGQEFVEQCGRLYSGLQSGVVNVPRLEQSELKERVEKIVAEAGVGNFSFRDILLVDMLKRRGKLGMLEMSRPIYEAEQIDESDRGKKTGVYDGEKILEDLTPDDATELIQRHRELKQEFVRKMIAMIVA